MLLFGDEVRRTQWGNNNAYCQDNAMSWFDWRLVERHAGLYRFCRGLIRLRRAHPTLYQRRVVKCPPELREDDGILWHGVRLNEPDWGENSRSLAFTLFSVGDDCSFHVMLNAYWDSLPFELPLPPSRGVWKRLVDTTLKSPDDLAEPGQEVAVPTGIYHVGPRSSVVLMDADHRLSTLPVVP
jgi:glycogen operon protein